MNYEQETKNYLDSLIKNQEEINRIMTDRPTKDKTDTGKGYLSILEGAITSISTFLSDDNLRKDYPDTLREMRNMYHQMYLRLKKPQKDDYFIFGQYQAARHLEKGLNNIIQSIAKFELEKMQEKQPTLHFTDDDKCLLLKIMKLSQA